MLHKMLAQSVKDVDARQGIVCGYASSFNVVDDGNDMVLPGAFAKTIAEQGPGSKQPRIKFLYQHDTTQILGVPYVLREDSFGLYFEAKIAPTTLGTDVLLLYSENCITEHSIGYEVVQADWDRAKGVRLLKELRLFEFSAVTFGMNPLTPVVGLKSLTQPEHLSALATKAAKLDSLLHSGNLHSDALCATLERELKALHTALAPTREAASQPYTIEGVLDSMSTLASRLSGKAASQADKDAQEARSKKYGIGIKDGGAVTKPGKYASLTDADFADPVNYAYPLDTKAHADNAAARFGDPDNRAVYTKAEQDIIDKRIAAAQEKFGEDDKNDSDKGATVNTRLIKGSGGDIAVSDDGTHAAYTGTHAHSHKAMGSQGGDSMHEHEHTHDGNADHGHDHGAKAADTVTTATATTTAAAPKAAQRAAMMQTAAAPTGRQVRKARDFDTLFNSLAEADQLQDDWGDTFIAFTTAMEELMWQASSIANGWATPAMAEGFDATEAAQANLDAFSKAVMSLVTRSLAANFAPMLDYDGDQFLDPDGVNASNPYDCDDDWKARQPAIAAPKAMPDAPALLRKEGRAISGANRQVITDALDGMSEAMKSLKGHHGAIADLLTKTDPDRTRQDEYNVEGDDDSANGGTNPNAPSGGAKHQQPHAPAAAAASTPRRSAATSAQAGQAATTHSQGSDTSIAHSDTTSALFANLDSVVSHLKATVAGRVQ